MSDRPTYPELLKFYYNQNFDVSLAGHSIALAIIHKSNQLYFPASFRMANKELSDLSRVAASNIGRSRQRMIDECKIAETPMFTYISRGRRKSGVYTINFRLTSEKLPINVRKLSDIRPEDDDPNKHNNIITGNTFLRKLEFKPGVINFGKQEHKDFIEAIRGHPKDRVEEAIADAKEKNIAATGVLRWVYNYLDQWDYRHQPTEEIPPPLAPEEEARQKFRNAVVWFRDRPDDISFHFYLTENMKLYDTDPALTAYVGTDKEALIAEIEAAAREVS